MVVPFDNVADVYLAAMSHLPNYVYYPQLARMNREKLASTI